MRYIFLLSLFISVTGYSQCKEYIIGVRGDTLNCVDMKGRKQGRWVVKVETVRGERGYEEEGVYVNGKKEGTWRLFSLEGDLTAIENYRWGNKDGRSIYYTHLGSPLREESWKAVNPDHPYDTMDVYDPNDPTRIIRKEIIKLQGFSLKHGTWKFYDSFNSSVAKSEKWYFDKPAKKESDELLPLEVSENGTETTAKKEEAPKPKVKPQAILEYEKKNSGKKKVRVRDGNTGG